MAEIFVRYFHFLGIIVLSSALICEHVLISCEMQNKQFKKLVMVDAAFGMGAAIVLVAGLLLWFQVGKPPEFYSKNWVFHLKVAIFIFVGLLSIIPTMFILRNRKSLAEKILVPSYIINIIRLEILLLVFIPLLAVLMARGYGLA